MIFTINLIFSFICSYSFSYFNNISSKNRFLTYLLVLSPVWLIWLIICGGQYYVGTDYEAYYNIFKYVDTEHYHFKHEHIFAWIVELSSFFNLHPQSTFYIFYFIGFLFLIYIISNLNHKTSFIFIFVYLTVSTVFHNQLNTLRQYIASYIITSAIILLYNQKNYFKFILLTSCASLIHLSSIFAFPFILLKKRLNLNYKFAKKLLIFSLLFLFFGNFSWFINIFIQFIPIQYKQYLGGVLDFSNSITFFLPKLIFVPLYFYSLVLLKKNSLQGLDLFLYKIGYISYCIRLFFMNNNIFNRIGDLFILLSIFPIYYLLSYLYTEKKKKTFYLICIFFIFFYLLKVIVFAKQEYLYNSIYI